MRAVYGQMRALDKALELDFETSMTLRGLGVALPEQLLPFNPRKVEMPSVAGEAMTFEITADPDALERYSGRLTQPDTPANHGNDHQPPPSAPASFVARALSVWKGE